MSDSENLLDESEVRSFISALAFVREFSISLISVKPGSVTVELPFDDGAVIAVRPPGELSSKPLVWPSTPSRYGSSSPHWNG